jgi:hypothetical protein
VITWGSADHHACYAERVADRRRWPRKCRHGGCSNANTHAGMANGVCLTSGCEFHMHQWARDSNRRQGRRK